MVAAAVSAPQLTASRPALVCRRADWPVRDDGRPVPEIETWSRYLGARSGSSVIVPMIACPRCEGIMFIFPDQEAVEAIAERYTARGLTPPDMKISKVDRLGKVTPDIQCGGTTPNGEARCGWSGTVYLDRWQDEKPLWCVAYVEGGSTKLELIYSHSINAAEAAFNLPPVGPRGRHIIASAPAVGFKVNEATGVYTA